MNPEIIGGFNNLSNLGQGLEVTNEAIAYVMEQSRNGAQASYRTASNQALNNQVAKFLQYILSHPKSNEMLQVLNLFMTGPNSVLFGEFCVFLSPFLSEAADKFAINQIYNINYHIINKKSEYISYINLLLENKYNLENVIKNEEITTFDRLAFDRLNKEKLWYYTDYILSVFEREDDNPKLED